MRIYRTLAVILFVVMTSFTISSGPSGENSGFLKKSWVPKHKKAVLSSIGTLLTVTVVIESSNESIVYVRAWTNNCFSEYTAAVSSGSVYPSGGNWYASDLVISLNGGSDGTVTLNGLLSNYLSDCDVS